MAFVAYNHAMAAGTVEGVQWHSVEVLQIQYIDKIVEMQIQSIDKIVEVPIQHIDNTIECLSVPKQSRSAFFVSSKQSVEQYNAAVKAGGGNKEAQQAKRIELGTLHLRVWKGCLKVLVERMNLAMVVVEQQFFHNQDVRQNQDAGKKKVQLTAG